LTKIIGIIDWILKFRNSKFLNLNQTNQADIS
jgi:hypothetical protein